MGNLLDELNNLKAAPKSQTGFPCSVKTFIDSINEKELAVFEEILANPKVSTASLWTLLNKNGHEVGKNSLYNHRTKKCRCFR